MSFQSTDSRLAQPTQCAADLTLTLRRERARADRTGGEFSLLTFSGDSLSDVERHLSQRARLIDQYAWTNDGRLWLILPDCPAEASLQLAQAICRQFSISSLRVKYDLFHYSAESQSNLSHHGNQQAPIASLAGNGNLADSPLARATPVWKRALDLCIASMALILLAPLLSLIAVLIKLTSKGPVLFMQIRAGRSGRPFSMYKFRTMAVDAEQRKAQLLACNEQDGPAFKMENDPRVTRIGRLLRATSMDELPQLWNVLRGDMTLVGPRPLPVDESELCAAWHQERLDVAPGLTCSWQVSDRRSKIPFAEWMRMDIRYTRRISPLLDLRLILQTIAFVIRRKGV